MPYLLYHINIYLIFFTPLPHLSLEPCSLIIQITVTAHMVCSAVFNPLNSFFTHYCQNNFAHMKSFNGSINFRIKVKLFRMTNETFGVLASAFQALTHSYHYLIGVLWTCHAVTYLYLCMCGSLSLKYSSHSGEFVLSFQKWAQTLFLGY